MWIDSIVTYIWSSNRFNLQMMPITHFSPSIDSDFRWIDSDRVFSLKTNFLLFLNPRPININSPHYFQQLNLFITFLYTINLSKTIRKHFLHIFVWEFGSKIRGTIIGCVISGEANNIFLRWAYITSFLKHQLWI